MKRYKIQYQMDEESPDTTVILVEAHQTIEKVLRKRIRQDLKHLGIDKEDIESIIGTLVILESEETI